MLHFTNGANDDHVREASFSHPAEEYLLFVRVSENDAQRDELLDKLQIKESDAEGVFLVAKNGT